MKTNHADGPFAYESLRVLDRRFRQILRELDRLQRLEWFRGVPPIKAVNCAVREIRAWTMMEILEVLRERAESEWMRLGRLRDDQERGRHTERHEESDPRAKKTTKR